MAAILPYRVEPLQELLEELDECRAALDSRGPLRRAWVGRLRRDLEAEAVAASTSMEGVPVTVEEVRRILAGERPSEVSEEDRELVEGYREAMNFVLRRADDPSFRWNRELLIALHDRIMAGRFSEGAGRFRGGPAYVVRRETRDQVFLPPPAEDVPKLVDSATRRLEEEEAHPAIVSAWIHAAIAAIHPFKDGNGRTARVLASLAMYRGGFKRPEFTSLEEWWGRHLRDYYQAFESLGKDFDPEADVTSFLEAHIMAQLHQVRALDSREKIQQQIWTALEEIVADRGLEPRTSNALWDVFFVREVTAGYYRSLADVSPATATKDLSALVASRLLKPRGERRGRRYLPTEDLYSEIGFWLGVEVSGPPPAARDRIVSALAERLRWTGDAFFGSTSTRETATPPAQRASGPG
jgi:Fic family protein